MKLIAVAATLLSLMGSQKAHAEAAVPLWGCHLNATVNDNSISVLVGIVNIEGKGQVQCMTALGQKLEPLDVVVRIFGVSVGPDISFPTGESTNLNLGSTTFGLSSLDSIYGEYTLTDARSAQLGNLKISASGNLLVTPSFHKPGIASGIVFGIQQGGQVGLGVNASLTGMSILTPAQAAAERFTAANGSGTDRESHHGR